MKNAERDYVKEEVYDRTDELIDEKALEEEEKKLDAKAVRKSCYVKRRRALTHDRKKAQLSKVAQKRKKQERKKLLGASIARTRKKEYNILRVKRGLQPI
jgi:hypothetical protein